MASAKGDRRARFRSPAPVEREPLVDRAVWAEAACEFVERIGLDPDDVEYFSSSSDGEVYVSVRKRNEDGEPLEPLAVDQIVYIWPAPEREPEPELPKKGSRK